MLKQKFKSLYDNSKESWCYIHNDVLIHCDVPRFSAVYATFNFNNLNEAHKKYVHENCIVKYFKLLVTGYKNIPKPKEQKIWTMRDLNIFKANYPNKTISTIHKEYFSDVSLRALQMFIYRMQKKGEL